MFLDDKKLIGLILKGDELAFEELLKKYLKAIYNFIYQMTRDTSMADDLTQETFIKAWKNIKKFDINRNFKIWIFAIAKNTAYDYLRKKKSIPFSFLKKEEENWNPEDISSEEILPNEILERKDLAEELERGIGKIPRKYRNILFLYYKEEFSLQEISEILKKPYNTVKSLHYRALLKLKRHLLKK